MLAYGLGAGLPLMAFGYLSREALLRWRGSLLSVGKGLKPVMGVLLVMLGILMLSGFDKAVEGKLVAASPDWLTRLTTRF